MKMSFFHINYMCLIGMLYEAPTVLFVIAIYSGTSSRFAPIATLRNVFAEAGVRRRRPIVQSLPESYAIRAEGCGPSCIFLVDIYIKH